MASIYVNMSCVMLALSIFLLSARYDLPDFYLEGHGKLINYEFIEMLLPAALFCLVTAFVLLYWTSYLRNARASKCLKIVAAVECFKGGKMSIIKSETVLWLRGLGNNTFLNCLYV